MHYWVYLLRCRDGSYYAGHSDNLEARLWQHREGLGCDWTSRRRPVELVWCEAAPTREEALAFERRIKGWTRAKKEALIAGDWKRIGWLARPPHERFYQQAPVSVRPERSAQREVEGGLAPASEQRPSTSLRTNEKSDRTNTVRPERAAQREVEGRPAPPSEIRPSTTFVSSEVETRLPTGPVRKP